MRQKRREAGASRRPGAGAAAGACLALLLAPGVALGFAAGARQAPASGGAPIETQIRPLLTRHCLACHSSGSKKGGLDLSRRETALAGGGSGRAIVPGRSAESLVWRHVAADVMPPKGRPRLSPQEKRLIQQWIDAGAPWAGEAARGAAGSAPGGAAETPWIRRLTVPEYVETVRSAVGVDVEEEARRLLPPDLRADGFSNTAYNLNVDLAHVEAYAALAQIIVRRMDTAAFAARYGRRGDRSDAAMRALIGGMGKWLLRGPLAPPETDAFLRVAGGIAKEGGDYDEAVRGVLEAMLQSPRFIYRIEKQSGDGKPRRLTGHELASRLSYAIWGAPPDAELMRAADAGELAGSDRVAAQVRRMLLDPRAVKRSARFLHEWLDLDRLDNMRPDSGRFPAWDSRLAADMRRETLAYFEEVAWKQRRPLAELLNAQVTFATPRLADHYGLQPDYAAGILQAGAAASGLEALYTFREGNGDTIRDVSGSGEPLDLKVEDPAGVRWDRRGLTVRAPALIASAAPARRLSEAIGKSKELTVEAWITPADDRQAGPARILTLSGGTVQRNFALGQDRDRFEMRLRTSGTDANGLPGLHSLNGIGQSRLTHLVYTRGAAGRASFYVNGEESSARSTPGQIASWDAGFRLALANELTRDRPWRGTYHMVAIYSRALSAEEVRARGTALTRYDLSSVPGRGGLLTHGSVLTVGGDEASMVARGLFVLHELLFSSVGSAPPGVDTTPVPTKPGLSQRVVSEKRLADRSCTGCHARFEPLAFGLEKFDGVGAYVETDEHGNRLREDGEVLFPGQEKPVAYRTAGELMDLLARSERVRMNFTRKVTQFVLGRPLLAADGPALDRIHRAAQAGGGTYQALITAVVMSDLLQMTQTEKTP